MSIERAIALLQIQRPQEALTALTGSDPEDWRTWYLRAMAMASLEQWKETERLVRNGLAIAPMEDELLSLLSTCRAEQGDLAGAEAAILDALRIDASNAQHLSQYALLVGRVGQLDKAEALLARASEEDAGDGTVLRARALLEYARGNGKLAELRTRELLSLNPEDPYGHHLTARLAEDRGSLFAARRHAVDAAHLDAEGFGGSARETLVRTHWLLWPLWPVQRFGAVPIWLFGVAMLFLLPRIHRPTAFWFTWIWLGYVIYSWVAPPLVRRLMR
ncbi:MAG TPA: hypothetical protein VF618_00745 [Thermoanaerobaculia bacterium]